MPTSDKSALFQRLPSTDSLLSEPAIRSLVEQEGHEAVTESIRSVLANLRREIAAGTICDNKGGDNSLDLALSGIVVATERTLRRSLSPSLVQVINATGVILHTNLGRAPLARDAIERMAATASGYSNLEFNLESGERGKRDAHVDRLFSKLLQESVEREGTGASSVQAKRSSTVSTIVVNNNAAAVLLALNTLAEGGEVIASRGELVEIGGSFRIPDVMRKSNATLREVGTTNRTRVSDYERAINDRTRLLLRVHRSNFEITGFTEQPTLAELTELAKRKNIPLLEDLGSGALFDLRSVGINGEPGVIDSLRVGVDVVCYSGDKLLGGPQAGLISGREDLVACMRSNSLFRALRVDKLTYSALEATLLSYVKHDHDAIPILRMMRMSKSAIARRARTLIEEMNNVQRKLLTTSKPGGLKLEIRDGESLIGGGAAPSALLPTSLISVSHVEMSADALSSRLRNHNPPIVTRVEDGRVLLDLRTVFPEQDANLVAALASLS